MPPNALDQPHLAVGVGNLDTTASQVYKLQVDLLLDVCVIRRQLLLWNTRGQLSGSEDCLLSFLLLGSVEEVLGSFLGSVEDVHDIIVLFGGLLVPAGRKQVLHC